MIQSKKPLLSVVIPAYNEGTSLQAFHTSLLAVVGSATNDDYEIIYINDGSRDQTVEIVRQIRQDDPKVKLVSLSRNFGKEMALTAGIAQATGQAILTLDGDGQHPVEIIPKFLAAWQAGARVVVGVRTNNHGQSRSKKAGSSLFHILFNHLSSQKLVPGSTDFRLIDSSVQKAFLELKETDRLTRGLIDWLGFQPQFVAFTPIARQTGQPGYSRGKLVRLAIDSVVSLSPAPLYVFGTLGILITACSLLLGAAIFIEQLLLSDPLHWKFTGTAMLSILILFFMGIVLMSQGLLSLYISHIQNQAKQRPLYVIDYANSDGIKG
jgi:glycosyltransferase involved in cell wall biosynthesis